MLSRNELESLTVASALGGSLTRGFEMSGFLSKNDLVALLAGAVRTTVIAGGVAGNHVVTGIRVGDALRAVLSLDVAQADHAALAHAGAAVSAHAAEVLTGVDLAATQTDHAVAARHPAHTVTQPSDHAALAHIRTWALADLTAEFAITAPDTINNGGGTNTTGRALVVVYEDLTP